MPEPSDDDQVAPSHSGESPPPPAAPLRIFDSRDLFQGSREILIEHGGEMYRLRITSKGRLILTK